MWHEVKNIFHFLIIFQCLFFSFYLLSQKNNRRLGNIILAAFLLSKAITEIGGALSHFLELKDLVLDSAPYLFYYPYPFHFLYMPLLFLYILSFTKKEFAFKKVYWLHFIPFIVCCGYIIAEYHFQNVGLIRERLQDGALFTPIEDQLSGLAEYLQFMIYAVASLLILRNYRQNIKEVYSYIENINLSWLNFVVFGFIGWKLLRFIDEVLWLATGQSNLTLYIIYIVAELAFLTFVCIMFLKGLKQPVVFTGNEVNQVRKKYQKTLLSDKQKEKYKNKLIDYMETQKPYLNPSLTLGQLARLVSLPAYQLSRVINSCLHQNFYDFINSYRVKESQRLLSEPAQDRKTVLEILYETGFNSKSVFNSAFKKYTGMTPTQFRKNQEC